MISISPVSMQWFLFGERQWKWSWMLNQVCIVFRIVRLNIDALADEETSKIPDVSIVEASAELLYGLVHQRFILTRAGLQAMVRYNCDPPCVAHRILGPG